LPEQLAAPARRAPPEEAVPAVLPAGRAALVAEPAAPAAGPAALPAAALSGRRAAGVRYGLPEEVAGHVPREAAGGVPPAEGFAPLEAAAGLPPAACLEPV